ncbi:P12 family lipoprotein (plasmid) [Borreliella sinica]|uniref:P12 family lipoprotein n=1 Tax=Borreliella sinica TaxID=87162 RepID=UPI003AEF7710
MRENIVAVSMLILISLLSCNTSGPTNKLTHKESKYENILGFVEEIQEDIEVAKQHMKEIEKQMVPAVSVKPTNVGISSPYYLRKEIKIQEEELVPNTDEEKEA